MATTLAQSLRADPVSRLSLRPVCSVDASTSIDQTLRCMVDRRVGCALVTDGGGTGGNGAPAPGQLIGIFTERDFVDRVLGAGLDLGQPISAVMTRSPKTINNTASIQSAIEMMEGGGYRHLPVLGEDARPTGVLSVKDVVHYLVEYFPANVYNLPPTPQLNQPAREGA
jgi:CBS domain-containing protein